MAEHRGVFPGRWALPGGGVEEDEQIRDALHREVREELGLSVTDERPVTFRDLLREKTFPDGRTQLVYMIFLIFECRVAAGDVRLNDEHVEYAWVEPTELERYDLDPYTEETLRLAGILSRGPQC
jgi:nucleoside triphosphatase